ncbi:TetR family transcriptional regulator [Streptomyces sp. WAC 06738]|uniref:TetR/AcrR family transcriptional regulator n=1 Tax=Streptomyces sp. WAC 06738 TaxID=2203210 RepID=UPI000F6E1078|nr:TetR family transcriptional regulator [Streptomyces sp. WAC 06738]AZM47488.1 TetR family transcriptional regulator [Streptomyces sp. WAC 06738]
MEQQDLPAGSLRARKQRRAREAIIKAAHELFAERGFDHVTVADIARHAEVGRATFFRHFGDKQEVVFGSDEQIDTVIAEAARAPVDAPIGDSLPAALAHVRTIVVAFMERLTEEPEAYTRHEQLVARHAELRARSLTKQRRYVEGLTELLREKGAERETAALAAEIGLACFYAGRTASGNDPARLAAAVDAAFGRLA